MSPGNAIGGISAAAAACLLLGLVVSAVPARAQTAQDLQRAQQESQRLQQEEQQRLELRRRELEERSRTPHGADLTPKPPAAPAKPTERCFNISRVELEGATKLSQADRAELISPYVGRCVGLGEVNELIQKITNLYVTRGYTTTRAYVPEQDMGTGVLRILVLEGLVERIDLDGSGVSLATAFPDLEGKVFNLRDFEQGLDQINRLRSNSATMDVEPGAAPGASVVKIHNAPAKRWSLGFSIDNTGVPSTGWYQAAATLGLDDALGLNDYLNVSLRQNPDANEARRLTRSKSLFYALPYGPWLFSVTASEFESASIIEGTIVSFLSQTASRSRAARAERVMARDQHLKLTLATGLTEKSSRNYVNGALVNVSSRDLTVWDGNANLSLNAWGGLWSFDVGFAKGLDLGGALVDPGGLPQEAPRAQFWKNTFGASLSMPLKIGGHDASLLSTLQGQQARDVLYGTEQILVGGPYSVRGFRQTSVAGDTGFYWRNELGFPLPLGKVLGDGAGVPPGVIKPYIGYDIGHVFDKYGVPGGTLAGITLGAYLIAAPLSLQVAYSRPERWSSRFASAGEDRYTFIRLSIDF